MGKKVTALTVAATIVCALGIGLFMQKRAEVQQSFAATDPNVVVDPATGALLLSDVSFTSVEPEPSAPATVPLTQPTTSASCAQTLTVTARPGAMLGVDVLAPCHAGERFSLHHGGIIITETIGAQGTFAMEIPALAYRSIVIVDFATGADLDGYAVVPDVDTVDRIVLQWQGELGFELHALEFGATYGEPGHVWGQSAPELGVGQMTILGDRSQLAPSLVEVYSIPRSKMMGAASPVEISIEAEITSANCDRHLDAQLIEHREGHLQTRDLTIEMPDCSAAGDFLVLNNLVESLKIATN
ncbi:hypothetical protein [Arenibacterium sp. LLYu02]|uniref:hypothetical protein n=1 Tax=Arenibacterium sp. LLYu02 TaxID=3404132 RepID=UPI003B220F0B